MLSNTVTHFSLLVQSTLRKDLFIQILLRAALLILTLGEEYKMKYPNDAWTCRAYLVTLRCGITEEVRVKTDLLTILLTGEAVGRIGAGSAVSNYLGQAGHAGPTISPLTFRTRIGCII